MAGLTAATELTAAGVRVRLFEKSRGPGGRMAAKRLPAAAKGSADIGAQYFTVRNPAFREFLQRHAGPDSWGEWQGCFRYQDDNDVWQDMRPAQRYVGIPRMSAITRAIAGNLDLQTGVRIARMQRGRDGSWRLTDTEGGHHDGFDTVIVTPPPAQTVELLRDSGLADVAGDLNLQISRMQACWTVVVHFTAATGAAMQGMMPKSPILSWAANNSSKPGREDDGEWWVLHGDPDWSDANTETDPDIVRRQLVDEFLRCSGINARPDDFLVHRWLYAKPRARTAPGHLWFEDQRIGIVGDWLDGGRVEGAFNSASGLIARLDSERLVALPQAGQ